MSPTERERRGEVECLDDKVEDLQEEIERLRAVVKAADEIRGQWWWRQWGRPPSSPQARDAIDAYDAARQALGEKE